MALSMSEDDGRAKAEVCCMDNIERASTSEEGRGRLWKTATDDIGGWWWMGWAGMREVDIGW